MNGGSVSTRRVSRDTEGENQRRRRRVSASPRPQGKGHTPWPSTRSLIFHRDGIIPTRRQRRIATETPIPIRRKSAAEFAVDARCRHRRRPRDDVGRPFCSPIRRGPFPTDVSHQSGAVRRDPGGDVLYYFRFLDRMVDERLPGLLCACAVDPYPGPDGVRPRGDRELPVPHTPREMCL